MTLVIVLAVIAVAALVLGVDLLLSRREQRSLGGPGQPGADSDLLGSGSASRGSAYAFSRGHGLLNKRERRPR